MNEIIRFKAKLKECETQFKESQFCNIKKHVLAAVIILAMGMTACSFEMMDGAPGSGKGPEIFLLPLIFVGKLYILK